MKKNNKKWYRNKERIIMKKMIGIVVASMMFANIGYAESKLIEKDRIKSKGSTGYFVSTICVDGFKFAVAKSGIDSIGIVQFFEIDYNVSVPAKC